MEKTKLIITYRETDPVNVTKRNHSPVEKKAIEPEDYKKMISFTLEDH